MCIGDGGLAGQLFPYTLAGMSEGQRPRLFAVFPFIPGVNLHREIDEVTPLLTCWHDELHEASL